MKLMMIAPMVLCISHAAFGYTTQEIDAMNATAKPYFNKEKRLEPHPAGQLTENVASFYDPKYHYTIYVPKAYTPDKLWPLLLCFSPSGNAGEYVKKMITVAEECGWIVAGAIESKNGPYEPIVENSFTMRYDIVSRYNICEPMIVYMGFSGGARASAAFCFQFFSNMTGGTIQCGAGHPGGDADNPAKNKNAQVYVICGKQDSNLEESKSWYDKCRPAVAAAEFITFDGDHTLPANELLHDALRWHTKQLIYSNPNGDEDLLAFRHQLIAPVSDEAKALETADKKVEAWTKYNELIKFVERFPKIGEKTKSLIKAANSSIRTLEKDKDVKTEKSASAALAKEIEASEKVADDKYKNKYIPKKFMAIYEKYPESPSGLKAKALSEEWEKKLGTSTTE